MPSDHESEAETAATPPVPPETRIASDPEAAQRHLPRQTASATVARSSIPYRRLPTAPWPCAASSTGRLAMHTAAPTSRFTLDVPTSRSRVDPLYELTLLGTMKRDV
jgi:hypothetical protein